MLGTIKSNAEISHIFSHGKRYDASSLTILALREVHEHGRQGRVAFLAGKKSGHAVWRNAAKRRMRAICHDLGGPWPNFDIVFLAKRKITRVSYNTVRAEAQKLLSALEKDHSDGA